MKPILTSIIIALALLAAMPGHALAGQMPTSAMNGASDSNEAMGPLVPIIAVVVILAVVLILVGAGIAIAAAVMGVIAILMITGIISTSVLVGMKDKRLESGARAFIVQLMAVLGAFAGGVIFCVAAFVEHLHWRLRTDIGVGIVCGIFSGIVVGLLVDSAWRRTRQWILAWSAKRKNQVQAGPLINQNHS